MDPTPVNICPKPEDWTKPITTDDRLSKCLFPLTAKATAVRDTSAFYVAKPGYGTTLTSTAVDADPLMVKSIAVNYKNPAIGVVSSAGAGAVTGFGIGGPWGAAIGGVLGAAGQLVVSKGEEKWYKRVCNEDREPDPTQFDKLVPSDTTVPQLFLPVTLTYENSKKGITECWHPLPNRSPDAMKAAMQKKAKQKKAMQETTMQNPQGLLPLSGWFYRIVPGDPKELSNSKLPPVLPIDLKPENKLDPPFQKRDEYFRITGNQETFPVSACRWVEVQITWWEMLNKKDDPDGYRYPLMVADSDYVQAIRIPKDGTVYLLPVCGGYASPTQSSSSLGDLIDAVVKQAQAVKDAQTKYEQKK